MRMQFRGRYLCYFCLLLIPLIAIVLAKKSIVSIDTISFTVDPLLAQSAAIELKKVIGDELKKNNNFNVQALQLKESYPFINTVSYALRLPKQVHVTITAMQPWLLVDQFILLHNGTLITKTLFDQHVLLQLPKIKAKQSDCVDKALLGWLDTYCNNLSREYELVIDNPMHLELKHKQSDQLIIVCDAHNRLTETLLKNCFAIQTELQNQQPIKNNMQWVADVRFEGQIVLYKR